MKRKWVVAIIGLALGVVVGVASLYSMSKLPFRPEFGGYRLMGIHKPEIVGFLPYWLLGKTDASYPQLTTLTYFGLQLNTDGTIKKLANPKEEEPGWTALWGAKWQAKAASTRKAGQRLSLLVQMSGEGSIQNLIASPVEHGQTIVSEVGPLMRQGGFTDLNLDIESFVEASPAARTQFTQLVQTVADGVHAQKLGTLTLDLSPSAIVKPFLYDPVELGKIVDTVVLMTYDYHYAGSYLAGAVAPLNGAGTEAEFDVATGIKEAMKAIPKEKLVMGIPLYGYTWETLTPRPKSPVVPGSGYAVSYRTILDLPQDCAGCQTGVDQRAQEPFLLYPSTDAGITKQVFYEDAAAIRQKLQLAKESRLAGVALWALGYESGALLDPVSEYGQFFWWEPALIK